MQTIAQRYGVSTKAIQRWAKDGAWKDQRTVIPLSKRKPDPQKLLEAEDRPIRQPSRINELEIVDLALSDLSAVLGGNCEPKFMGSVASGICRLIELRLKLKPRTAAEVAELAMELGIEPSDFVAALKDKWRLRA